MNQKNKSYNVSVGNNRIKLQVFPPSFQELPPPALELFDLDEAFSSDLLKLSQLTNKYLGNKDQSNEMELDYYIREFGGIIRMPNSETCSAKEVLNNIFQKLASFKKVRN